MTLRERYEMYANESLELGAEHRTISLMTTYLPRIGHIVGFSDNGTGVMLAVQEFFDDHFVTMDGLAIPYIFPIVRVTKEQMTAALAQRSNLTLPKSGLVV